MNPRAEKVARKLSDAGFTAYFAGGCVRDFLLGREAKDVDIATNATPEDAQKIFKRVTDLQGKAFGVVRVMEGEETFEVATFRKEGPYKDGRRPESVVFTTAEEDASRRDFTVNGLFYDPIKKKVIDYVGGEADLKKKILRAIGKAEDRFSEDYLRVLRAVRFAAELEFEIGKKTWDGVCKLAEKTKHLAIERVRDELNKCFTGKNPQRALDLLDASGLLKIWLPEVIEQKSVEQPPEFHPEGDVYTHVHLMMGYLSNAPMELAWSVLLHDIGKPPTFKVDAKGRIRFNGHETAGAHMAKKILQRLRFSNDQIEAVVACVANHMTFKDVLSMRVSTLKRLLARPTIDTELELHKLDCIGSHADLEIYNFLLQKREEFGAEQIKPPPLVKGEDVLALGMQPGPKVGEILAVIEEEQLEGKLTSRGDALKRLEDLVSKTDIPKK
ncbi:MAG: CCA tRNA nucleotidyltransferase [Verrucomicrobiota bacterium]